MGYIFGTPHNFNVHSFRRFGKTLKSLTDEISVKALHEGFHLGRLRFEFARTSSYLPLWIGPRMNSDHLSVH